MDTNRRHELMSDYIENTISPGDRAAMDAELRNNPEARAELAALRGVWRGLDDFGSTPVNDAPMFFRDNVMSAIERTGTRKGFWPGESARGNATPSFWQQWFPNAGRLAAAAGVGATLAAVGLLAFGGGTPDGPLISRIAKTGFPVARVANNLVLPYSGQDVGSDAVEAMPRFVITTGRTLTADAAHACDFTFWLENASQGSARFTVLNGENATGAAEDQTFRFRGLSDKAPQTLRVPFDPAKTTAMVVQVRWTALGTVHDRLLVVPTSAAAIAGSDEATAASTPPSEFTLAEMPLLDALKEVTSRTDVPIIIEDVPNTDALRVAFAASGKESVSSVLRRGLAPLGLHVSRSPAGVLITPVQ